MSYVKKIHNSPLRQQEKFDIERELYLSLTSTDRFFPLWIVSSQFNRRGDESPCHNRDRVSTPVVLSVRFGLLVRHSISISSNIGSPFLRHSNVLKETSEIGILNFFSSLFIFYHVTREEGRIQWTKNTYTLPLHSFLFTFS